MNKIRSFDEQNFREQRKQMISCDACDRWWRLIINTEQISDIAPTDKTKA